MIRKDPALLRRFRRPCEMCGAPGGCPHHMLSRGAGGGGRLDVPLNLVSLCNTCHRAVHDGKIPRLEVAGLIARREGLASGEEVLERLWELRRRRK